MKPLILITNDDGVNADGLGYLKSALDEVGHIHIVAPEAEQSAVGHSITLHDPIKVHEVNKNGRFYGHAISGTPADAVKLAIYSLLQRKPDLVVSGINDGANLGINVLHSGTVSAATEAAILGVPAIAVSLAQQKNPPYEWAVPHVEKIARWVLRSGLPPGVALNVNIPVIEPHQVKGYRLTRQGLAKFEENYEEREDPRGNIYYWLSGEILPEEADGRTDLQALREGFVSITPLFYDLTAHAHTDALAVSLESL